MSISSDINPLTSFSSSALRMLATTASVAASYCEATIINGNWEFYLCSKGFLIFLLLLIITINRFMMNEYTYSCVYMYVCMHVSLHICMYVSVDAWIVVRYDCISMDVEDVV